MPRASISTALNCIGCVASCWRIPRTRNGGTPKPRSAWLSRLPGSKERRPWSTRPTKACAAGPRKSGCLESLFEHDLIRKSVSTFRNHALRFFRLNHDLRLRHQRTQPAVISGDAGLPDHGGAAAMERRAFGARGVADGDRREEIGLAFDGRGAAAFGQVGKGRGAAEIVGERHDCAAMHGPEPVVELFANENLGLDLVLGQVRDFHSHKIGKWRLQFGVSPHVMAHRWTATLSLTARLSRGGASISMPAPVPDMQRARPQPRSGIRDGLWRFYFGAGTTRM